MIYSSQILIIACLICSCSDFISDGKNRKDYDRSPYISVKGTGNVTRAPVATAPSEGASAATSLVLNARTIKSSCPTFLETSFANDVLDVVLSSLGRELTYTIGEHTNPDALCIVQGYVTIPTNHIFNISLANLNIQAATDARAGESTSLDIATFHTINGVNYGVNYNTNITGPNIGTRESQFIKSNQESVDSSGFKPMTCEDKRKTDTIVKFTIKYQIGLTVTPPVGAEMFRTVRVEYLNQPKFLLKLQKCP